MARREPDPLPSVIPSPRAAPVSTYYDPRLPLPRMDPTVSELQAMASSLTKWGLMQREDDKEKAKVDAAAAAWAISDEELREMVEKGIAPESSPDARMISPSPGPGEIQEEADLRAKVFDESTKELRQTFLNLRKDGLPKNADPFWRKWYDKVLGERLAGLYKSEVEIRLKETYELNADTGRPKSDYSDLAHEVYDKYAPMLGELGEDGQNAFTILKGQSDDSLVEKSRLALNEYEEAQVTSEWTSGNVNYMVEAFSDGTLNANEFAVLQARYRDARFEVDEVRSHFVANLKTAASRFVQLERDGKLEPGQGKELALDLLEALVPAGDDGKGVILGTSIKADQLLMGDISAFRAGLEDNYEKDERAADRRVNEKAEKELWSVVSPLAEAGASEDEILAAAMAFVQVDGELSKLDVDTVNGIVFSLRHITEEDKAEGEWSAAQKSQFEGEFTARELEGATPEEQMEFLRESGAAYGHSDYAMRQMNRIQSLEYLSNRVQTDPELGTALKSMTQSQYQDGGREYSDAFSAQEARALKEIGTTDTPEEAEEVAAKHKALLDDLSKKERERVKAVKDKVQGFTNTFDREGAGTYLEGEREGLNPDVFSRLEAQIGRMPNEVEFTDRLARAAARAIGMEQDSRPLYAENKLLAEEDVLPDPNKEPHKKMMQDGSRRSANVMRRVLQAWEESEGKGLTPLERESSVLRQTEGIIDEEFEGWYESYTALDDEGAKAVFVGTIEAGRSPLMIESWKLAQPDNVPPVAVEAIQAWEGTGRMPPSVRTYRSGADGSLERVDGAATIRHRLADQTNYVPDGPSKLGDARDRDIASLQFFLKPTAPPEDQAVLPDGMLSGRPGTEWGDKYASSEGMSQQARDRIAITVGRNRVMSVRDVLEGTWTIPADEAPPDFATSMDEWKSGKYGQYGPHGWRRSVPYKGSLGTKHWKTETYSYAQIPGAWGMQKDYEVEISPARIAFLGLAPFNHKSDFLMQSNEDADLLHILATGEDRKDGEPVVMIYGEPLNDVRKRFLSSFGITSATVNDPDKNFTDDKLEDWCGLIHREQLKMAKALQAY